MVLSKKNSFSNSQYLVMDALAMGCIAKKNKIRLKFRMTKKKKRKDKEKISKASIKLKIYFCTNVILSLAYSWIFFFLDCFVSSTEIVINAVSIFLSFSLSLSLCKCSSAGTGIWRRGRNF